jgi:virginiamycin B lyase
MRRRCGIEALIAAALLAHAAAAPAAAQDTTPGTFPGPAPSTRSSELVPGPDGKVWLAFRGPSGARLLSVAPDGQEAETALPGESDVRGLVVDPSGNVWYLAADHVGELSPGGTASQFKVPDATSLGAIARAGDGSIWFSGSFGSTSQLGRVAADGSVSTFPLPQGSDAGVLRTAPDGSVWYANLASNKAIGRINPDGSTSEAALDGPSPRDLAITPDGNVWFSDVGGLGRLTPQGLVSQIRDPATDAPLQTAGDQLQTLAPTSDGSLWFPLAGLGVPNALGRIAPDGSLWQYQLGAPAKVPVTLRAASDGALWGIFGDGRIGRINPAALVSPQADCAVPPADALAKVWQANRTRLNCPLGAPQQFNGALQPFQNGQMVWLNLDPTNREIFVFGAPNASAWSLVETDAWQDGTPEPTDQPQPPAGGGLLVPIRGFGKVWHDDALAKEIGWATQPEQGFSGGVLQRFHGGVMLWSSDAPANAGGQQVWVAYTDQSAGVYRPSGDLAHQQP